MADIDLSASTTYPLIYTQAAVATTWQSYTLPSWAVKVTVVCETSVGAYAGFIQTGTPSVVPVDGAAVGTHRTPCAQNAYVQFNLKTDAATDSPRTNGETAATQVFVAAQSSTATITLIVERA